MNILEFQSEIQCKDSLYVVPLLHGNGDIVSAFLKISSDWQNNEKPLYLSLLMNEKQLLTIINNKHLFDSEMISSAYALLAEYERIKIEYTE